MANVVTAQMRIDATDLYVALFGRAPDDLGLGYWVTGLAAGKTVVQTANEMYAVDAARVQYPAFLSPDQIIANFYTQTLGRAPEAEASAYWVAKLAAPGATEGSVIRDLIFATKNFVATTTGTAAELAIQALGTASKNLLLNKSDVALFYAVNGGKVAGAALALVGVTADAASVVTAKAALATSISASSGSTFTLTTGVDVLTGTGGNDTFIADNSAAANLTAADQVTGGAGTDTLKIFQAAATNLANTVFGQLSSVERVEINSGTLTDTGNLNITAQTGVTTVKVISPVAMGDNTAFTFTGTATQSIALQQVAGVVGAQTSTVNLASGISSVTVDRFNTDVTLNLAGTGNTLTLATTGGSAAAANNSNFALTNTGNNLRTINISGDQTLTITTNGAVAGAVTTVNASTATAAVNYINSAAVVPGTFAFTGGSGNDNLTFINNGLAALASGTSIKGGAGTDKVSLLDTALTAAEIARINAFDSIETLGLNADINVDTSAITTIKSYAIDTATTVVLANLGSGVTTDVSITSTSLTLAPAVGTTSTALTIGSATANTNVALGTLVTTGLSTISIASNGSGTGGNTITTLTNSDNSAITITGTQALTLTLAAGAAAGSSINGASASGVLTLAGSGFGDIITGGTGNDFLNGNAGADKLTGGAGNDIFRFDSLAETQGAAFAGNNVNSNNVDSITDFAGNGASAGDSIQLAVALNAFSAAAGGLQFATTTVANVTAITVATAADFTTLTANAQAVTAGTLSSAATAQVYDITVTAGAMAGRYVIINDDTAAIAATDTIIAITGATGALNAQDFTFA